MDHRIGAKGAAQKTGGLAPLGVNRLIEEMVPVLKKIVDQRAKLLARPARMELKILANREKMGQVFASIVAYGAGLVRKGGTITILAKLLPLGSGLPKKGGCALLTVSSDDLPPAGRPAGTRPGHISRKSARRAFAAIRSIVREHHGSLSLVRAEGKAQFHIFLPLLSEEPGPEPA